ncbi:RimK/LysX family protein [Tropicimonas sp. IMCC6043]|uniref:ATP-dependent zinc protease family protein n=1 Tax=Tropicimonas sp. IMCC6043 TaxID=2510645 RepID=UPI00101BFA79|nr:RimK/LysX family protein [Tropicimonas sp. IMCC6043]RYH11829.1 ATP-dependent zinc protease [Tropicimonas sp. IMCC6043]
MPSDRDTALPRKTRRKRPAKPPLTIGWREVVSLPELGLLDFAAKIDTGARTTALHATEITAYRQDDGELWVQFRPPDLKHPAPDLCHARVSDRRGVKNSGGSVEERLFIRSRLMIEKRSFLVEISLTDRGELRYPMIIGRNALRGHRLVVDCGHSWLTRPGVSSRTQKDPAK